MVFGLSSRNGKRRLSRLLSCFLNLVRMLVRLCCMSDFGYSFASL